MSLYKKHTDLPVYNMAFEAAREVFVISKRGIGNGEWRMEK